ncbi:MAG: class I SAM-dependent methyltransferase [Pseudomonadota bacterium]
MSDDGYFDEPVAAIYDDDEAMFDSKAVDPVVSLLANLAGEGGRALELGIGTGRIALPLSRRGIEVAGIDLSKAMLRRLGAKPGAERISTVVGDFSTTRVEGSFDLVYLVFNTIMNLTTQAAQVACFSNAAAHLEPGGHFVIEVMIPRLQLLAPGERHVAWDISESHWGVDEYDLVNQGLVSHHLRQIDGALQKSAISCRYVWPAELDLMAQLAGMSLTARWAGWHQEPFDAESTSHVSVWSRPE